MGRFRSRGNVLVEGSFHGQLEADKTVLVARGAQIQAQLRASDTIVCGSFDGEIVCERLLKIASSATISGEIKTPVLVIEEGATVNCRFTMARAGGLLAVINTTTTRASYGVTADPAPQTLSESRIDSDSHFNGLYETRQDLRIEGVAEGEIRCQGTLTVMEGARVVARVSAKAVTIAGQLEGRCGL